MTIDIEYDTTDYSRFNNGICTISCWCLFCFGSGLRRHRSHSIDPRITIKTCARCHGARRLFVRKDSQFHKKSIGITPGLWPGIRKSKIL